MNPLTRLARSAYYLLFALIAKALLPNTRRLYRLGTILGKVRYNIGYVGKNRSKRWYLFYLREALPHYTEARRREILQRFWIDHEKSFLELFLIPRLTKENIDDFIEFEGLETLDEGLSAGRGIVLAVPHFGNARLLHISLAIKGYPMNVISSRYSEASESVRRTLLAPSLKWHNVGFPDMSPRWMLEALKRNEVLQISPTAFGGRKGCWLKFMGGRVMVSTSPVRLAVSTGAFLVPAFILRLDDDRHRIVIKPRLKIEAQDTPGKTVEHNTRRLMRVVEEEALKFPTQFSWMWFVIRRQQAENLAPPG